MNVIFIFPCAVQRNVFPRSVFTEGEAEAGAVERAGPPVSRLLLSACAPASLYCLTQ